MMVAVRAPGEAALLVADDVGALGWRERERIGRELRIALEVGEAHDASLPERVEQLQRREPLGVEAEPDLA